MGTTDTNEPEEPQRIEIAVTKGNVICLDNPSDCSLMRRVTMLPSAWATLTEIARGSQIKPPLAEDLRQEEIERIELAWKVLGDDADLALPLMDVDPDVLHGWPPFAGRWGRGLPLEGGDQPLHPIYLPAPSIRS
jgi:hypothetical protein